MQDIIVQKYGGTSVGTVARIRNVARRITRQRKKGFRLVVVVSAMAGETDRLIELAHAVNPLPTPREMDMIVSTGEQVSIALLAMALHAQKCDAVSMTGAQVGITTDSAFTRARIVDINTKTIRKQLHEHGVVIVAGFQGKDTAGDITTLGRGGSDLSAVALAAVLKAAKCEIYTDVDGIYTANPRIVKNAKKLKRISYTEMMEMASLGAKVMHNRSVMFAKKYNVQLEVRSSLNNNPGTIIMKEMKEMEKVAVTGVTISKSEARVTIHSIPDKPGIAAKIFTALAHAGINVDVITQTTGADRKSSISFTVAANDVARTKKVMSTVNVKMKGIVDYDDNIGIISLIGTGMRMHHGVASKMFDALARAGINIEMITTSEIRISCIINQKDLTKAANIIHKTFQLDKRKQ